MKLAAAGLMRFPVLSPALGALVFVTACAVPVDDIEEVQDRHVHASHLEVPELPKLPSRPLTHIPHGNFANFATENVRVDENGEPQIGIPRLAADRKITQKVLLLGATGEEPAYLAAKTALDRIGVPYRALLAAGPNEEMLTSLTMTDNISVCNYSGVVIATSGLGYEFAPDLWMSAFTPEEWQALADFENACSARELVWYGWPGAEFGLALVGSFDFTSSVNAGLTPAGQSLFVRVKDAAVIPYRHAFGYRASIPTPTDGSTTTALVADGDGSVLVASHVGADGRETLVSTVDASPFLTHSQVLEYDFVRWVTRGMFVGKKRVYLAPQIDDLFLDNNMWVVGQGNADNETSTFRLTGTDLTSFVAWQTARKASLPAGSTFITDMAFNGIGTDTTLYPDATLLAAAKAAGNKLTWLNHTWDHDNLDAVTAAKAKTEVAKNCSLAKTLKLHGFNCNELVTPDMSGLQTLASVQGLLGAGVKFVVSDTSITEERRPGFPGTNPSFNVGRTNPLDARLYQIPRHPTSIFYDTSSPETEADEYNHIYPAFGGRLAYEQILDKDSEFGLYYLLIGDIDPLMFHQANLDDYGGGRSIYGDWIDAVVTKYLALTDAPILTLSQNEIGNAMQARGKLDACGLTVTMVESAGTRSLRLTSTKACTVPLTGVVAPTSGLVETYAGDPTTFVTMLAGQTKIVPLL